MSVMSAFEGRERYSTVTLAWPVPAQTQPVRDDDRQDHGACGIASSARVSTPQGPVRADELRSGDLVLDASGRALRVATAIRVASVLGTERLKIRAGALGGGLPRSDLVVGRRTRLLLRSELARRLVGRDAVLVAAERLEGRKQVSAAPKVLEDVTHLVFEEYATIVVEGVPVEALVPGAAFMESLPADLAEMACADMPKLRYANAAAAYATDLPELDGREARQILDGECSFAADHGSPDMVASPRKARTARMGSHPVPGTIAAGRVARRVGSSVPESGRVG